MKAEELKGKSADELKTMLLDMRKEQMNLRFQQGAGQLASTAQIRVVRRNIARVKTALNGLAGTSVKNTEKAAPKKAAKKKA